MAHFIPLHSPPAHYPTNTARYYIDPQINLLYLTHLHVIQDQPASFMNTQQIIYLLSKEYIQIPVNTTCNNIIN